jgi:hypothetical protein
MRNAPARPWIWLSLLLQFLGYVLDAVWHGLLHPGVEPATVAEMVRHLGTVHLPLYVGAVSAAVSTSWALSSEIKQSRPGLALPIAVGGALMSAGAEAWHAYSHLRLDTHSAPLAGTLSVLGFLVVVVAMSLSAAARRRRVGHQEKTTERRVAARRSGGQV